MWPSIMIKLCNLIEISNAISAERISFTQIINQSRIQNQKCLIVAAKQFHTVQSIVSKRITNFTSSFAMVKLNLFPIGLVNMQTCTQISINT